MLLWFEFCLSTVPPRITPFQFGEEPLNFGEPASIQCTLAGGDWPMSVEWLFNNYHMPSHLNIATTKFTRHTHVLAIESVTGEHAGNYTCVARNWAGEAAFTAALIVNVPPKITPFTFGDEPLNFGEPVSVHCTVSGGDLPILVTWTLNNEPLHPELEILTEKHGKRIHNLMIDAIEAKHAGNYTCIASNLAGTIEHSAELIVNVLPQIIPFSYEDNINIGDSVDLLCQIKKGDRPIKINWSFERSAIDSRYDNVQPVMRTNRVNSKSNILSIPEAMPAHTGIYTCTATNSAGSTKYSTNLLVNGI